MKGRGRWFGAFVLIACTTGVLANCATETKNTYAIRQLAPALLYVRRPLSVPASASASPGGYDYSGHPAPAGKMDCQETRSLAAGFDLRAFRSCIAEVNKAGEKPRFRFRLQRVDQPYLELRNPDDAPECIRKLLSKIPVPREIFYQALPPVLPSRQAGAGTAVAGRDTGPYYDCFAASVDLEADEIMGSKVHMAKWELEIQFPLKSLALRTDEEALRLYLGWAIMPFFGKEKGEWNVPSKFVPFHICKMCMDEARMLKTGDPLPLLWP